MSEIPKAYEPQSVEDKWYDFWLKQGCFTADPARVSDKRPAYSIVIPPPNVTGMLHMGHVLNNTIQDILSRKARMDGKEVLWLPGTDHAGIATEGMVAKQLRKEEKKTKQDIGREEFIKRVWTWKEKHGGIIIAQLKKLGCSCDWTRERFTMDPDYVRNVQRVFVDLYKKGLIYRGKRMVNWCPATQTALSDEEVEMRPQKGFMYHFKVEVAELVGQASSPASSPTGVPPAGAAEDDRTTTAAGDGCATTGIWLTIATTRPETIPGDTAVAVNPKDTRYAHLIGKHIVRPLPIQLPREQKLIPIIGDEHVDFEFGTGVLKVTPAHDKADFDIGQRHKLPVVEVINADGTMNALAGADLKGLERFAARKVAVEALRESGVLVEEQPYENNVGFSQRADVPIEPRLSEQWFLKYPSVVASKACVEQEASDGKSLEAHLSEEKLDTQPASNAGHTVVHSFGADKMRFHPQRWAKVYDHWLTNIQDWCISRQLWWGHRVPVWYNRKALGQMDASQFQKSVRILHIPRETLPGSNIKELRASAWAWAESHGLLGQIVQNHDTGWRIEIRKASLEHSFSNYGVGVVKVIPYLVELLEGSVRVASRPHEPQVPDWVAVHTFAAAYSVEGKLYRAKFTVKERADGHLLYDHQTAEVIKEKEADGNWSPAPHPGEGKLDVRPASASAIKVGELLSDVNPVRCQLESPGPGWEQDPDVLDTWFSSWLWPFATMGWPEQTLTLKAFYPTTDLVTGPDIIFFWVARMIMAGYEFMGEMPFRNVYFTGIIRDKLGRKMSKTLGNSPDPLELIAKYGADALRFGTMRSAPLGQDVLFDEKDVELGRNFCNKLWNACRFRQMQGAQGSAGVPPATEGVPPEQFQTEAEINPALLTSDDQWILLRLDLAIREVSDALASYNFATAVQTLYRFFWSEYCDWYVEASKAVFYGENATLKANKLAVIDFILSHTLRLFHPFLPFITEELWHGMSYQLDLPDDQGGRTIMTARWPKPLSDDEKAHYGLNAGAEQMATAKYDLVGQGRNLRREFNISPGKKVRFILKPALPLPAQETEVIRLLLNAESLDLDPGYQPKKGTPTALSPLGELFLPLDGLVDVAAEQARLAKELAKIETEIEKVHAKLNNPAFTQKVPPAVLEEHQKRLADWQAKRTQLQTSLKSLES